MTEAVLPFDELEANVLAMLKGQGYMDSTLTVYRRIYNMVHVFINQHGTDFYSSEAGKQFLDSRLVSKSTLIAYACAIRRLDDFIHGNPYRCHHGNPSETVSEVFSDILTGFLEDCKNNGNKSATVLTKKRACIMFLNYLEKEDCSDLSCLNTASVSKALLIFSNKDMYAIIRLFLRYLADRQVTKTDFSGIVPKYRRRKVLPTTYTPAEISKVEASISLDTDTGKRNLSIIRLATRMGLRSGDIAKLKWAEINFSEGIISILQEKTGMPLSLQMPQEVADMLLLHHETTGSRWKDDFVFHSASAPYGRITTSIIRHIVFKAFMDAGVNITGKKHGPHVFRSSLASSMINDGASYETVRKILGHSDPNVIKHYARTDIEKLRNCAIEPPKPSGIFKDYLTGKKVIAHV